MLTLFTLYKELQAIHKFLRAGVMVSGMVENSPEGVPQPR